MMSMRIKHVRFKTKQTLQFGKQEITVSCIIIPTDQIRIITHFWLKCQLCRIGRMQVPLPSKNSESCFMCNSSIYIYNTFIGIGSGNSLFNMQIVKYFSGTGRRPCSPLQYVKLPSMSSSILSIKWCCWRCFHWNGNSRRAGFHDPCSFVTDTYRHTYTRVITERSPFRAFGVLSLQPIITERSNKTNWIHLLVLRYFVFWYENVGKQRIRWNPVPIVYRNKTFNQMSPSCFSFCQVEVLILHLIPKLQESLTF